MHVRKIAMLRYESTGAARCWAMAVRAISARAPATSARPPTEQKIHAGKKEPKMLYSGACEQPVNVNDNPSDKAPSSPNDRLPRRLRIVRSTAIFRTPRVCRRPCFCPDSAASAAGHSNFAMLNPNSTVISGSIWDPDKTAMRSFTGTISGVQASRDRTLAS